MELKIKEMSFPEAIEFNFEELKQELTEKVEHYKTLVYTDDQVKEAKKDVATLRKFTKALSDERIKVKKQCLQPYEAFEKKVKELTTIVDEPISLIDKQVKEYEEEQRQKKMDEILDYWECLKDDDNIPEWLSYEKIYDEKWLNASVSMKSIKESIGKIVKQVNQDIDTIKTQKSNYEYEMLDKYCQTLNLSEAVNLATTLRNRDEQKAAFEAEKAKREAESKQASHEKPMEQKVEEPRQWISFKANLTVKQAMELKEFFEDRNIEFDAI